MGPWRADIWYNIFMFNGNDKHFVPQVFCKTLFLFKSIFWWILFGTTLFWKVWRVRVTRVVSSCNLFFTMSLHALLPPSLDICSGRMFSLINHWKLRKNYVLILFRLNLKMRVPLLNMIGLQ